MINLAGRNALLCILSEQSDLLTEVVVMMMIDLLIRDAETLATEYPAARAFLLEARLRKEMFNLLCTQKSYLLTEVQYRRLAELRLAPACNESWFIDLLSANHLPVHPPPPAGD